MIEQQLNKILEIGTQILTTLDKDNIELGTVEQLYQERGEAIHKLDYLALVNELNWERKNEIQSLFEHLKKQEVELNIRLMSFAKQKQQALGRLDTHKKAKESYTQRAPETLSHARQIIDLKQS